jgi:hypothetical protein
MSSVEMVIAGQTLSVNSELLGRTRGLFVSSPPRSRYNVRSQVAVALFNAFVRFLEGTPVEITPENRAGLTDLCHEFGSWGLYSRIVSFNASQERAQQRQIAALKEMVAGLTAVVSGLSQWTLPLPGPIDSRIIGEIPELFEGFRGKRFILVWRWTRDGCWASDFHTRCDGHPNTVSVILDTAGNVFGGFTPLRWESATGHCPDPSLNSFLFSLMNPHGIVARKFALIQDRVEEAIYCHPSYGPTFGRGHDIHVRDGSCWGSYTHLGSSFTNDTVKASS